MIDIENKQLGIIFNIERYAVFDGPGIRTIVFLKGCHLHCRWCQNPEGQNPEVELAFFADNCIGCMNCTSVCPHGAIYIVNGMSTTDWDRCKQSHKCVEVCQTEARKQVGEKITAEQVVEEVEKDVAFYRRSGGGVTLSGGEPIMQPDFAAEILRLCRSKYISTTVETSGFARSDDLMKVLEYADFIYYDVKHMDSKKHMEGTGFGNELTLENLEKIPVGRNLVVRVPVVPGYNDSEKNIRETAIFVRKMGKIKKIELLPYNRLGVLKYERIGKKYLLSDLETPTAREMSKLQSLVESCGIQCEVV